MKKIYYLQTCDTCKRILKQFNFSNFEKQELKNNPITVNQLDELKNLSGNFESIFSRRAKLYKGMGLKGVALTEGDYKHYLLNHYTFLKRPIIIDDNNIFVGSDKANLARLENHFK